MIRNLLWQTLKLLFWSYCPKCSWPIRLRDSLKRIMWKKLSYQFDYMFADRVSYKLMGMARCVQSTQNNKFAILCNTLRNR